MLNDLRSRHLPGQTSGQVAVCSAHPLVLAAAAARAKKDRAVLLQFLPDLTEAITSGALPATPEAILQARIQSALHPYVDACRRHAHTA